MVACCRLVHQYLCFGLAALGVEAPSVYSLIATPNRACGENIPSQCPSNGPGFGIVSDGYTRRSGGGEERVFPDVQLLAAVAAIAQLLSAVAFPPVAPESPPLAAGATGPAAGSSSVPFCDAVCLLNLSILSPRGDKGLRLRV